MNRSTIPNLITCLNLFSGCIGIVLALKGHIEWACMLIWIAAVFDFLDGLVARSLKAFSEMGKQLDSLADMVSFGVLPGTILFMIFEQSTSNEYLPGIAFLVTIASGWRLAKFNIDSEQSDSFKGLPTPASAIFISGLPFIQFFNINSLILVVIISIALSVLMVSNISLLALKFKNYSWASNHVRYLLLIASLIILVFLRLEGISLVILNYLIFSIIGQKARS